MAGGAERLAEPRARATIAAPTPFETTPTGPTMPEILAWTVLIVGFALPLAHVLLSPAGGPWRPPPGSGCPLGPRVGWLVLVVMLGPIGWLLFMSARRRHASR